MKQEICDQHRLYRHSHIKAFLPSHQRASCVYLYTIYLCIHLKTFCTKFSRCVYEVKAGLYTFFANSYISCILVFSHGANFSTIYKCIRVFEPNFWLGCVWKWGNMYPKEMKTQRFMWYGAWHLEREVFKHFHQLVIYTFELINLIQIYEHVSSNQHHTVIAKNRKATVNMNEWNCAGMPK